MQIIKYIILIFIWLGTSLLGKMIAQKYRYRVYELEDMKNALYIFKNKIKFTYSPIGEIFEEISKNSMQNNISNLFKQVNQNIKQGETASKAWDYVIEKIIEEKTSNMKEEDLKKIQSLSKLLRNIRCRRSNKSNRNDRRIIRNTNTRSTRRKKEK